MTHPIDTTAIRQRADASDVPLVEVAKEDEWFEVGSVDLDEGDLVQDAVGGWHVGNGSGGIACLIRCGYCTKFRRPRGPVTLTYTPPETP